MGSLEQHFYVSLHQSEYIDSSIAHELHETISKSITRHVPQQSNDVIATHFLSYTSRSRDFAREFSHRHARYCNSWSRSRRFFLASNIYNIL